jgi:hypothetical protein
MLGGFAGLIRQPSDQIGMDGAVGESTGPARCDPNEIAGAPLDDLPECIVDRVNEFDPRSCASMVFE